MPEVIRNKKLVLLHDLLNDARKAHDKSPIAINDLIDGLRLISAPYRLEAVVAYSRLFKKLIDQNKINIESLKDIPDLDNRISVILEIADLANPPKHFATTSKDPEKTSPLRPNTGDGPICELLLLGLIKADAEYDQIIVWLIWILLRFHHKNCEYEDYARYITSEELQDLRPSRTRYGRVLDQASLEIRKYSDKRHISEKSGLAEFELRQSNQYAEYIAQITELVKGKLEVDKDRIERLMNDYSFDYEKVRLDFTLVRQNMPPALGRLLRIIWLGAGIERRDSSKKEKSRQEEARRALFNARVDAFAPILDFVDQDEGNPGVGDVVISLYPGAVAKKKKRRTPFPGEIVDTAEDHDQPKKQIIRLYLEDNAMDPAATYYAAKGLQYAQEYRNAKLAWARHRISQVGLEKLVENLLLPTDEMEDEAIERGARILIIISLLTGRKLRSAMNAWITSPNKEMVAGREIVINRDLETIQVLGARPANRTTPTDELPAGDSIFHEQVDYLELRMPSILKELIGNAEWLTDNNLLLKRYFQHASKLIKRIPSEYCIDASAIREFLGIQIREKCGGDLGIVKVITNCSDLNSENIIAYASYPENYVNRVWADAAELVFQGKEALYVGDNPDGKQLYFGSPHSINKDVLREHIAELRPRYDEAIALGEFTRAFNLYTLYTLLWLNLATASRARVSPAPMALIGNLALVSDKHREDDSAERVVPLSERVLAQLGAYFAFVWHLSFQHPELKPVLRDLESGILNFQFFDSDGKLIGYRPKWLAEHSKLIGLPGNWARKFVRSELVDIGGRYLDMFMGHWVMGRHPYRLTSTVDQEDARRLWLAGQSRLEGELGFTVWAIEGFEKPPVEWPLPHDLINPFHGRVQKKEDKAEDDCESNGEEDLEVKDEATLNPSQLVADVDTTSKEYRFSEVEEAFRKGNERLFESLSADKKRDVAAAAQLIRQSAKKYDEDFEACREIAEKCCEYVREKWGLGIYAERPRRQFQRDWLIDRSAICNLAFFDSEVLPGFQNDLQRLPDRPSIPEDSKRLDRASQIEIGRFLMLCIWRQGLTTWPVLDAFINSYLTGGILATGELRYIPSDIKCRRNGAPMHRLYYLEPFCQSYFVFEHVYLRQVITPLLKLDSRKRRGTLQTALKAYLSSFVDLSVGNVLTLTLMAAQQYHMLRGTPLLAGYASAEYETHDLPDIEIRRLFDLPARDGGFSGGNNLYSTEDYTRDDIIDFPAGVIPQDKDIVNQIISFDLKQGSKKSKSDKILGSREALQSHLQKLLQSEAGKRVERNPLRYLVLLFSIWLVKRELQSKRGRIHETEWTRFVRLVQVVGYSIIGFCPHRMHEVFIDEALILSLEEQFSDIHPDLNQRDAFQIFRRYLRQTTSQKALSNYGVQIGDVEEGKLHRVYTKILRADYKSYLYSVINNPNYSGLAFPDVQIAAKRHYALVDAFGLRRTEAEGFRQVDLQGDQLRVQPYGEHTLKTANSERVCPVEYLIGDSFQWLSTPIDNNQPKLINRSLSRDVKGHSFFAPVNSLIQKITDDADAHLHILRHTAASDLLLSMLNFILESGNIEEEFPWIKGHVIPKERLQVLLGGEGFSGHGLQVISALLGHSHPTTTLRYYIHTVGIAFYAYLKTLPAIDTKHSFDSRLGVRKAQRLREKWSAEENDADQSVTLYKRFIDYAEKKNPGVVHKDDSGKMELNPINDPEYATECNDSESLKYANLIQLDMVMRGEVPNDNKYDLEKIERALYRLYEIPSGRRVSAENQGTYKRHPAKLTDLTDSGKRVPKRPRAKSPTSAASRFCEWLENLRQQDEVLFNWLLKKWLNDSSAAEGRMLLKGEDLKMWKKLPRTAYVHPIIIDKRYGRLDCMSDLGEPVRHDIVVVRWVLTWACALLNFS